MHMQFTTKDNVNIEYNLQGDGDTTLLLVHGSCIDQSYWKDQVSHFSNKYKVVTLDLAGHGLSGHDRKQYSVDSWTNDIVELIQHLYLKNVVLVGHSMGGAIIMFLANKIPGVVKGFVSVDFFKNAGNPLPKEYDEKSKEIIQGLKDDFEHTNMWYAKNLLMTNETPKAVADRVINEYKNADPKTVRDIMVDIFETAYKDEQRLLPQLPVKFYSINADYMPTNEEALNILCTNGYEVVNMHGTCHYPMIEYPDVFNKELEEVLMKIDQGS
ncbi:MAG: alpha/beta hydrolase [Sphingobacteriales bacterium]|nr:MAG: alpha/beta hydrolase [Sphingobacteriales bacterium]